ncbi:MAG: alpha-galactosidase [Oscillospiraceae bacterium]|nr:alpha-galactosidase [Oscillospiraceae bacterium]
MIRIDEKTGIFALYTKHTVMILQVVDGFVGMPYYGEKIRLAETDYLCRTDIRPFTPEQLPGEAVSFHSAFPHAYPFYGCGNFREPAFRAEQQDGSDTCCLKYIGCSMYKQKPKIPQLPQSFTKNCNTETLILYLHDEQAGVLAEVIYTLFQDSDIIAQSVRIQNQGEYPVMLRRVLSSCLCLEGELELITLNGTWARERYMQREPVGYGVKSIGSINGASSHTHNPFIAAVRPETTETQGEAWGMAFVYSGNFYACAEKDFQDKTQIMMGIHPDTFCWELESGKSFYTPEVLLNYSCRGLGRFSRNYHDFIRNHIIRSKYQYQERPVLVNSWEAFYFDFDSEKLLHLADTALACGLDMLVIDDGWFGHRDSDDSSLGDWFVNEKKIPQGMEWLGEQIQERNLKLGLWFEPEMISPDSELFQAHPDWAVQIPDRSITMSRNQYVLDLTRPEIRSYIFRSMADVIHEADISYIKWDMNRQITEAYTPSLPAHRQKEFFHRYILAVYEIQERLLKTFPDLMIENCAGGGGRFDCGMLYYSPQIWCSDNTDACDRAEIQLGTSLCYPPSCMGAHISACPNHIIGRKTDFMTRAHVALAGTFGYELDLMRMRQSEIQQIQTQIELYHEYSHLTREGSFYRLLQNACHIAWEFASPNRTEILVTVIQIRNKANQPRMHLKLQGLLPDSFYIFDGKVYTGSQLMRIGIPVPLMWGDGVSSLLYLTAENKE